MRQFGTFIHRSETMETTSAKHFNNCSDTCHFYFSYFKVVQMCSKLLNRFASKINQPSYSMFDNRLASTKSLWWFLFRTFSISDFLNYCIVVPFVAIYSRCIVETKW